MSGRDDEGGLLGLLIVLVGTVAVLGITVATWFLLIKPANVEFTKTKRRAELKQEQLKKAGKQFEEAKGRLSDVDINIRRLKRKLDRSKPTAKKLASGKKASLSAIRGKLGDETSADETIQRLVRMARSSEVLVRKLEKEEQARDGVLTKLTVKLDVTGTYSRLVTWLRLAMTGKGRVLVADSLDVTRVMALPHAFAQRDPDAQGVKRLRIKGILNLWTMSEDARGDVPRFSNRPVDKDSWRAIRGSFWAFSNRVLDERRDPFESRLHLFVEGSKAVIEEGKPAPKQPEKPEESEPKLAKPEPKPTTAETPEKPVSAKNILTAHPTLAYEMVGVVTGGDKPMAIVEAPDGNPHVVRVDTRLGNAKGVVAEITADSVVVDEPAATDPITLKLKKKK